MAEGSVGGNRLNFSDEDVDFFEAANDGSKEGLRQFLNSNPGIIDKRNEDGNTALHLCLGHYKCAKLLIAHGANTDLTNNAGFTPLQEAARRDMVESLIQLLISGADKNGIPEGGQTADDSKLPVALAAENNANATRDLLLFCGAMIPQRGLSGMTAEEKNRHLQIQTGYKDGKIIFGSATLKQGSVKYDSIQGLDLELKLGVVEEEDVEFICRRVKVEYQTTCTGTREIDVGDREKLISDVYQYRVNRGADCDIQIPVHCGDRAIPYNDVYVRQIAYTSYADDAERQDDVGLIRVVGDETKADFTGIPLTAYNEGSIVSLAVIAKNKILRKSLEHGIQQKFVSEVTATFKVTKPAGALVHANSIALEVIQVDGSDEGDTISLSNGSDDASSDIDSLSDFHSVLTEGERQGAMGSNVSGFSREGNLTIEIPVPNYNTGADYKLFLLGSDEDDNPTDACSWKSKPCDQVSGRTLTFTGRCGRFIAVVLKRAETVGYAVKEMIKDLYIKLTGPKIECRLFAAVKSVDGQIFQYLVRVVLCTDNEFDAEIRQHQGFVVQRTDELRDKKFPKTKPYFVRFHMYDGSGTVLENEKPIQYQKGTKYVDFQVKKTKDVEPFGCIDVYKTRPKKKEIEARNSKYKLQVYFNLETERRRDSFPSSSFVSEISPLIGEAYFPIGIYLGMPVSLMQDLRDQGRERCAKKVLDYWVDNMYTGNSCGPEEPLRKLFFALKEADRHNVRKKFVVEMYKKCPKNSSEITWLERFKEDGDSFNFNLILADFRVSPFDDAFLYIVAKRLVPHGQELLQQLNTGSLVDYKPDLREPDAVRKKAFDLLLLSKSRDGNEPQLQFLKQLFKALERDRSMNLLRKRLNKILLPWFTDFNSQDRTGFSERTNRDIRKIMVLIDLKT